MELTSEEYGHQGAPPDGFLKSHRLPVYAKAAVSECASQVGAWPGGGSLSVLLLVQAPSA